MTDGHCFISYSAADGLEFATKLAEELLAMPTPENVVEALVGEGVGVVWVGNL